MTLALRDMGGRAVGPSEGTADALPLRDRARAMPGCEMVALRASVGRGAGSSAPTVGLRPSSDRRADGAARGGDGWQGGAAVVSRRIITVSVRPCSVSKAAMPSSSALQ